MYQLACHFVFPGNSTKCPFLWIYGADEDCLHISGVSVDENHRYICRVSERYAKLPGKLDISDEVHKCMIGFGGKEITYFTYEALVLYPSVDTHISHMWVDMNIEDEIPADALYTGHSEHGDPLFTIRTYFHLQMQYHAGYVNDKKCRKKVSVPWGGMEFSPTKFQIFVTNAYRMCNDV